MFNNNLLELYLNKNKHVVFNIQNVIIQSNLNIWDYSSQCLDSNKFKCSYVCTENVNYIKIYLGLFLDSQLKWKNRLFSKLYSYIFIHLL
jgi:hypothetical protein